MLDFSPSNFVAGIAGLIRASSPVAADAILRFKAELEETNNVDAVVTPSHLAQLWKNVFTGLKIYEDFPVTEKMDSGWAVRHDSPKLQALLEEFASTHREGTAYYTMCGVRI